MARYPRLRTQGENYFFTVALTDQTSDFLTANVGLIRAAYCATQRAAPFLCDAFMLLPDHLHTVWTLPLGDHDFSIRWARFKTNVSRCPPSSAIRSPSKIARRKKGLWPTAPHEAFTPYATAPDLIRGLNQIGGAIGSRSRVKPGMVMCSVAKKPRNRQD